MPRNLDYLKAASALSKQPRGVINYDRLAQAGLPGEIVLNNIMSRIIDASQGVDEEYRPRLKPGNGRRVSLGLGGTTSYLNGGLMVADNITLLAETAHPKATFPAPRGITGASVSYTLANERNETWDMHDTTWRSADEPTARILATYSAPFNDLQRRVMWDLQRALTDPEVFVTDLAEQFVNAEGMDRLAYLGHDAVSGMVATQAQAA